MSPNVFSAPDSNGQDTIPSKYYVSPQGTTGSTDENHKL